MLNIGFIRRVDQLKGIQINASWKEHDNKQTTKREAAPSNTNTTQGSSWSYKILGNFLWKEMEAGPELDII